MAWVADFKKFAVQGNALDLAVGVIIGGAFGKIVSSLVSDLIMPMAGLLLGKVDFNNLFLNLGDGDYATLAAAQEAGAPVLAYGTFVQNVVDFLIVAVVIFLMVRAINRAKHQEEPAPAAPPAPPAPPEDVLLLREIRDSLKKA